MPELKTINACEIVLKLADSEEDIADCMQIRMEVFVREQGVDPALELDEYDDISRHYLALVGITPIATARLIPKGNIAKIGRVAVLKEYRGRSIGLRLMQSVTQDAVKLGFSEALLDSQTYAIPFYERLGFIAEGDEFLDADIPHYRMRKTLA